jgi:hypothetical protein
MRSSRTPTREMLEKTQAEIDKVTCYIDQMNCDGTGPPARRQANVNQMESQQSSSPPPAGGGNHHGQSSQTNRNYPSCNNQRPASGNTGKQHGTGHIS